jgi:hypothetical protein
MGLAFLQEISRIVWRPTLSLFCRFNLAAEECMSQMYQRLLGEIRKITAADADRTPDAELLARFVQHRDTLAFDLLFWRHARMVWGVCRRLLRDGPDAEDAFQATFVVLARKAASIGHGQAIAGWLSTVWRTGRP